MSTGPSSTIWTCYPSWASSTRRSTNSRTAGQETFEDLGLYRARDRPGGTEFLAVSLNALIQRAARGLRRRLHSRSTSLRPTAPILRRPGRLLSVHSKLSFLTGDCLLRIRISTPSSRTEAQLERCGSAFGMIGQPRRLSSWLYGSSRRGVGRVLDPQR